MFEAAASRMGFPVRIELIFKEYFLHIPLLQIALFSSVEKTHLSPQIKRPMLHAPASSTFFPGKSRGRFERNTTCNFCFSK
jgi:hypothetical protein